MKLRASIFAFVAILGFTGHAMANDAMGSPAMVSNRYTYSTPAVQGYDVVSYFTGKRPVRGNGNFVAVHDGATYQFSSANNQKAFEKNPGKYVPAFGGYCAFGVSVGKKFIGDPEVWRIVDDKLYLNLDTGVQSEWLKDIPGRIETANKTWRSIEYKDPQSL